MRHRHLLPFLAIAVLCTPAPEGERHHEVARVAAPLQPLQAQQPPSSSGGVQELPALIPNLERNAKTTLVLKTSRLRPRAKFVETVVERDTRAVEPPQPEPGDIYAELDRLDPPEIYKPSPTARSGPRRIPANERPPPIHEPTPEITYPTTALGIGVAGIGLATLAMAVTQDNPTTETTVFSGAMLGIGAVAFAVGGIVYLVEAGDSGEQARIGIGPGGVLLDGSF